MANEYSDNQSTVPRSLKIVALLFAAGGLISAVKMLAGLVGGGLRLELGIIDFWVAAGLLRFDRKWLKWGKRFIWFELVIIDVVSLAMSFSQRQTRFRFGPFSQDISSTAALAGFLVVAGISLWKLRVLTRPEIDELFPEEPSAIPSVVRSFAHRQELGMPAPSQTPAPAAAATPIPMERSTNAGTSHLDLK